MIDTLSAQYSVVIISEVLLVSTSSYYAWRRKENYIDAQHVHLQAAARTLFADSRQSLSSRTMSYTGAPKDTFVQDFAPALN